MYSTAHTFRLKHFFRSAYPLVLAILSCILILSFTACSATSPSTTAPFPEEFRIGYQAVPNAELIAKSMGIVEETFPDVKVRWIPYSSGYRVSVAMIENDIDIGLVGSVPVSTGIAQGLPYQVYLIHNIIGDNEALVVTKASGIKSVTDLEGKKIGVPFGSTSHFSLLAALKQANIEQTTVTVLDMQPAEMLTAWKRGIIDGGFVWQPTLGSMILAEGNVLATAKSLSSEGIITADVGVVRQDFAASYPTFLTSYIEILDAAVHLYQTQPEEAAALAAKELKISPETSLAVMNELVWIDAQQQSTAAYLGTPGAPGDFAQVLKDSAEFMVSQKAIPAAPELESFQKALLNEFVAEVGG